MNVLCARWFFMNELICRVRRSSGKILFLTAWVLLEFTLGSSAQNESEALAESSGPSVVGKEPMKRDPFWPVGYVPKSQTVEVPVVENSAAQVDWESAETQLKVSAVGEKLGAPFVVINGKVMTEGVLFQIKINRVTYTWEVPEIDPGKSAMAVELRRVSAETE